MTASIQLYVPGGELLPRQRHFGPTDITEQMPVLSPTLLDHTTSMNPVVLDYPAPLGQTPFGESLYGRSPVGALPAPVTESATRFGIGRFLAVTLAQALSWCQLSLAVMAVLLGVASGQAPILIEGNSMQPSMQPGDVIVLEAIDATKPLVGRIVTFTNEKGRVTHRVIEEPNPGEYVTKGDASANPENETQTVDSLLGAGKAVVPKIGLPMIWFRQGRFMLFGVWLVCTLAIAAIAIGGLSADKEDRADDDELEQDDGW